MSPRFIPRNFSNRPGDCHPEMDPLDDRMAARLLGGLPPDEAPQGYRGVATLLHAARTEARSTTSARAEDTVAAMVAAVTGNQAKVVVPQRGARPAPTATSRARRLRSKVAAGASAGFLAVFGSLTAAGALPSAAQNGMSTVLSKVGIEVPRGDGSVKPSHDKDKQDNGNNGTGEVPASETNHGQCVSEVAGSGGEVVSEVARSDCGKDPKDPKPENPGNSNGPPGGEPPGQTKDKDTTPPTHPPQSNSGGSGGSSNGNGNGHGGLGQA